MQRHSKPSRAHQHRRHRITRPLASACVAGALLCGLATPAHAGLFDFLSQPKNDTATQYPIVMVHGLFGFGNALGVVDYFWGIPGDLRKGGAKVYIAEVSSVSSNEVRGEQLLAQINHIMAVTGARKVNIIAHSQGGTTARYVTAVAPEKVASLTTVGAPHKGSPLGDLVTQVTDGLAPEGSPLRGIVVQIVSAIGRVMDTVVGKPGPATSDPLGALRDNATPAQLVFNAKFPEGLPPTRCGTNGAAQAKGVRYYSWVGNKAVTNIVDPFDWLTSVVQLIYKEPNDGINDACTQRLGTVVGEYAWNHFDEINQLAGLRGLFTPDPVGVYHAHVARLKQAGL
ncbi:MAG: triacylglycerol lipase [Aquabacterium sp.]|uniref:esterase/lipase family protein n=1 Tax=Aquabacterium sp. TaxID=1872578 RepID=UPI0025C2518F|nr:triacylglycerol lipase [Aquabacterium sp.]MBI5924730.1 triacylglycerol lipase [Aquabacterium sp.]